MFNKKGLFLLFISLILLATIPAQAKKRKAEPEPEEPQEPQSYLIEEVREIAGPRRTITVGGFQSTDAFAASYGDWDIGGGLAAMLTSALVDSDRFIVVERAAISDILVEKELHSAGLTTAPETAAPPRQLAGVQLLIYGAVTEFDTRTDSGGFSIGVSLKLWKGGAGKKKTEGIVAFDFRIVDARTGEILETHSVSRSIIAKGFDVSIGYEGISLGDDNFSKTPLGQASREAVTEAVHLIAENAAKTAWSGLVVEFDGREMYVNAGTRSGVTAGDEFIVERIDKVMTDPQTGEVLLVRKSQLGTVRVLDVLEKLSVGVFTPTSNRSPDRGDLVVLPLEDG